MEEKKNSCDLPAVEDILAEMVEHRELLTPLAENAWDAIVSATPKEKLAKLERRFYTPMRVCGAEYRRMWKLAPGDYKLLFLDSQFGEAVLQDPTDHQQLRVRLPRSLQSRRQRPGTHLKITGGYRRSPKKRAEWVRY